MTPAGLAAFEARDEDRSAIYSYEQRHKAKLEPEQEARLRADPAAWEWFQSRPPSWRQGGRLLDHERQEARDARAAAGDADRGRGRRPHAEGAHAARVIRRAGRVRMLAHERHRRPRPGPPLRDPRALRRPPRVRRRRPRPRLHHPVPRPHDPVRALRGDRGLAAAGDRRPRAPARPRRDDGDPRRHAAPPARRRRGRRARAGAGAPGRPHDGVPRAARRATRGCARSSGSHASARAARRCRGSPRASTSSWTSGTSTRRASRCSRRSPTRARIRRGGSPSTCRWSRRASRRSGASRASTSRGGCRTTCARARGSRGWRRRRRSAPRSTATCAAPGCGR